MSHEPVVIPNQMHQGARVAVWPDVDLVKCPAHLGLNSLLEGVFSVAIYSDWSLQLRTSENP